MKLGTLLMPLSSLLPRKAHAMQDLHQGYVPARTTKAETPKMMAKELASLSSAGASASGVLGSAAELEPFERVMSELKGLGCWSTVSSMMEESTCSTTCLAASNGIWGMGTSALQMLYSLSSLSAQQATDKTVRA